MHVELVVHNSQIFSFFVSQVFSKRNFICILLSILLFPDFFEIFFSVSKLKRLVSGAVPSLNLPIKTIPPTTEAPRRDIVRHKIDMPIVYQNLEDFKKKIFRLKLTGWSKREVDDTMVFEYPDQVYALPKFSFKVDRSLNYSIAIYNWFLPDDHRIYCDYKRSLRFTTFSTIESTLMQSKICKGVEKIDELLPQTSSVVKSKLFEHTIPLQLEHYEENGPPFQAHTFQRSEHCELLCSSETTCSNCIQALRRSKKPSSENPIPLKEKAPLSKASKNRLIATIQKQRVVCKELEGRITQLEKEIATNSIPINETLEKDILTILASNSDELTPHMKVFWEQQQKLLGMPSFGRRYHPHIIRFCLSLHAKSPAGYRELRDSGVLILPSEKTLRDYRNFFKPKAGFNFDNIERLKNQTNQYFDFRRYVVLAFDEMKIQSKLVFDKHSNELIGFVDLGEKELTDSAFGSHEIATHVLVFFVRGVATDLKYVLGYFFTKDLTAYQITVLFWKAVSALELVCNLWVCATVCDGASPNRGFFQLHATLMEGDASDIVHFTVNLFAPHRKIFFFSDAPHLLKTARNCLFNSGTGKTRYMWNNGQYMLWEHVANLYYSDLDSGLHQLPKLTTQHIQLKSYSKMKVSFAAQILSNTVAQALARYYRSGEASETAKFCKMLNDFFDCMNVRSSSESQRKRNPLIAPYTKSDDFRFNWMMNVFLKYLDDWKSSIQTRDGNFTSDDRARMFLSMQTFKGLKISVRSAVDVIKFLLNEGVEFVLTERFCQDDVEEYFGFQRAQGRRSDNPTVAEFGYNDNRIAILRDIAPAIAEGNVSGRHSGKARKWSNVSEEPLPKRKR